MDISKPKAALIILKALLSLEFIAVMWFTAKAQLQKCSL